MEYFDRTTGTPNSVSAASESDAEMKSLAEVKIEVKKEQAEMEKYQKDSPVDGGLQGTETPTRKLSTTVSTQPDTLTEEVRDLRHYGKELTHPLTIPSPISNVTEFNFNY